LKYLLEKFLISRRSLFSYIYLRQNCGLYKYVQTIVNRARDEW